MARKLVPQTVLGVSGWVQARCWASIVLSLWECLPVCLGNENAGQKSEEFPAEALKGQFLDQRRPRVTLMPSQERLPSPKACPQSSPCFRGWGLSPRPAHLAESVPFVHQVNPAEVLDAREHSEDTRVRVIHLWTGGEQRP